MLLRLKQLKEKFFGKRNQQTNTETEIVAEELCCNGKVHIAYRGLADDRMYISYNRHWDEVKFFRQNSLKVFCADCRRHVF